MLFFKDTVNGLQLTSYYDKYNKFSTGKYKNILPLYKVFQYLKFFSQLHTKRYGQDNICL
jgi:hypothetical protein